MTVYVNSLNQRVGALSLFLVIILCFSNTINLNHGISDNYIIYNENLYLRDFVIKNTEQNSIIMSQVSDKVFFPTRRTIAISLIGANKGSNNIPDRGWLVEVSEKTFYNNLIPLLGEEENIYLLLDSNYLDVDELNNLLKSNGYIFIPYHKELSWELYKLVPLSSTSQN